MGGGGDFYDRDVTTSSLRTSSGATRVAEQALSRSSLDPSVSPKNRRLSCETEDPLVYACDVTGSMGILPKIIYDKWPGIVGQVAARKYLPDPQMSLAAVGDIQSDRAPLQMADFSVLRNLDRYFKSLWLEGNGGGQGQESYEMTAYYYAYLCDLPNVKIPIFLFTGDEGFRDTLYADDLRRHFGGEHKDTTAKQVFADLLKKFKGNVFLIHRYYDNSGSDKPTDESIVEQWRWLLGQRRIIFLPKGSDGDLAIGDITLGLYAIVSGARTLEQYLQDMRTRPLDLGQDVKYEPQSPERIAAVEKALQPLKNFKPVRAPSSKDKEEKKEDEDEELGPQPKAKTGPKGKKPKKDWKL